MTKKLITVFCAAVVLCLCCSISFAVENNNSITLGNEIMKSIDKTEGSMSNMMTSNAVTDTGREIKDGMNDVSGRVLDGVDNAEDKTMTDERRISNTNYNVTQTTTEGSVERNGINTMTTTTWMWIILAVAAIIIITAIWYYATQNND